MSTSKWLLCKSACDTTSIMGGTLHPLWEKQNTHYGRKTTPIMGGILHLLWEEHHTNYGRYTTPIMEETLHPLWEKHHTNYGSNPYTHYTTGGTPHQLWEVVTPIMREAPHPLWEKHTFYGRNTTNTQETVNWRILTALRWRTLLTCRQITGT